MEKRLCLFIASLFLYVGGVLAQVPVRGLVVTAEDGEPVVGASVKVEGTQTGTVTDTEGRFSLNVPSTNTKLQISYIGLKPQTVKASKEMKIVMESDNQQLQDVMVVAFGTQKKSAFTGSASVVDSKELSKHITTNVANALTSTVPGLQIRGGSGAPGAGNGSINIRGISSLELGTTPLIIVDGAPYSASLSNIPQEDIESVTVLKDAASAALYGARGASGVIIITTKKGNSQEAKVSVDMKWGSNSRAVQDYDVFKDAGSYYEAYYGMLYNKYYYGEGMSVAAANQMANTNMLSQLGYNVYTVPDNELLIGTDGKLNPKATLGRSYKSRNGETYYLTPDNWTDAAYKNSFRQEYNVNVSGGNTRSSFYASAGYLKDDGVIEYSGYERITARIKADYQAKKWLKVGANVGFVHSNMTANPNMDTSFNSTNLMYFTSSMAPIYPIYVRVLDANGNPTIRTDNYGNPQYDYGVPATNYVDNPVRAFSSQGNPLGANRYNQDRSVNNQFNGTFTADITFTDWLKMNISSNANFGQGTDSYYSNMLYGPTVSVNGRMTKVQSNTLRTNNVQTLDFHKLFGQHDVDVMVGHEYYRTKTRYLSGVRSGGFSPSILELNAFAKVENNGSYTTLYNVEGFFSRALYNYQEKYFASASYRRDASSRFAKKNGKWWGDFWSVGAAWAMHKEPWFQVDWVNNLKLKLSIGQQGNDNVGSYYYTDLYTLSKASDTQMSPSFALLGNPDLTWETTTNFNVGVEFGILNNLVSGSLDVYNKKISDMLFWISLPESVGTRGYYGNIGDMRNRGFELTLTVNPIRTHDVNWTITGSIAHNTTKILKLPAQKTMDYGGYVDNGTGNDCWYAVGGPLYNAFLVKYAGVNDQGQALYYVDTTVPEGKRTSYPSQLQDATTTDWSKAGRYTTGSLLPKATGGFSTSVSAYGFDASVSFDYQIGGKIYDTHYAMLMTPVQSKGNGQNFSTDILKSWTPNNTSSNIPRFWFGDKYTSETSTRFLTKASYLNFQSFTLGYTLPKRLLRLTPLSSVRFYVAGENLCFWSARKGLDPRYSYAANTQVSVYSPVRNVSGGIQVTF